MDVVVEVGGWEHECCGPAIERYQLVDLGCLRARGQGGRALLVETHHDLEPVERVRGRVVDLHVLREPGEPEPVLRVPSGQALRGSDPDDDGHLEHPWTGDRLVEGGGFLVTVERSAGPGRRSLARD